MNLRDTNIDTHDIPFPFLQLSPTPYPQPEEMHLAFLTDKLVLLSTESSMDTELADLSLLFKCNMLCSCTKNKLTRYRLGDLASEYNPIVSMTHLYHMRYGD